jgi:hypothetical protein
VALVQCRRRAIWLLLCAAGGGMGRRGAVPPVFYVSPGTGVGTAWCWTGGALRSLSAISCRCGSVRSARKASYVIHDVRIDRSIGSVRGRVQQSQNSSKITRHVAEENSEAAR